MFNWNLHLKIFALCFLKGASCKSIDLTPTQADVDINKTLTFTCTYNGYDRVLGTKWNIDNRYTPTIVRQQNGTCIGSGIFANMTNYKVECPSDITFSVTILRAQPEDHNVTWQCFDRDRKSIEVKMFVNVPIDKVSLSLSIQSSGFMIEHSKQLVNCTTSAGRPKPKVTWYIFELNKSLKHDITVNSSTQNLNSDTEGLVAVKSTLFLYPNRSINSWALYCKAWSSNESQAVKSNNVILNVAYPPDKAPVIFGLKDGVNYTLIEYEVGKLSCSSNDGNPLPSLTWNCYNNEPASITIEDKNLTSTVKWIGLRGQVSCSCKSNHSWSKTTQVTSETIDVLYPPNKPTFYISEKKVSGEIKVILKNNVQVKCESESNPLPYYSWTDQSDNARNVQELNLTITSIRNSIYNCTASNQMLRPNGTYVNGRNESSVTIQVLYPPRKPKFKYELTNGTLVSAGTMIDVVKGDSFSIHCNATGNPLPTYHWDNTISHEVLRISSITSDSNKTCRAKNEMKETVGVQKTGETSALFSIRVLRPPCTPTITISSGTKKINITASTIQLREKDNINMTCFSEGKPYPNYTWTSPKTHIQRNTCSLANISRNDTGNYSCYVNNVMYRTFGKMEQGSNSSSIFLNIMYPSTISPLKDIYTLEGSNHNITCQVQKGNPTMENITWTRAIDTTMWESNQLVMNNVSRSDDTKYTCTLQSTIKPTIGDDTLTVKNRTFHLNVFFPSEIKIFTVKNSDSRETFIINKTEKVSLECKAEANPASNLSITNPRGNKVSTMRGTNALHYNISNASFENAGRYICEGRNNYTIGKSSVSKLIMIVKCPPRPSPFIALANKVAASQYTNTTLQFFAQKYLDEDNKTEFMWFKQKSQLAEKFDFKFEIHSIGLNSSLTIRNITQPDFGEYSVKVSNTVGEYIHHYVLQAEDKPDVPINFTFIPGSITDSSVTLDWTPGFDGGSQQTFVLLYQLSKEEIWHNVQVKDTNSKTMNFILTGLLSSEVYYMKMFARNLLGNSSTTHVLQITTEEKVIVSDSQSSDKAGILGGSISCVAVSITISIIFAAIYIRKRSRIKYQQNSEILYQNTAVSCSETDLPNPYERLDSIRKDINTYSELQQVQKRNKDTYNDRISDAGSETLEIDHEKAIYINMKI